MNLEDNKVALNDDVVSVKEWIITLLIMTVPLVNVVMMFVWAFGGGAKRSKSNFFKALLIMVLIGAVLSFLCFLLLGGLFASLGGRFF